VRTGGFPSLSRGAKDSAQTPSSGPPLRCRRRKLDQLAGQGTGHQHQAVRSLDYRVAATANRANLASFRALGRHEV
ncbi:MAG: hypothetical protein WBN29_17515, partial [Polyangiales bacterium]